MTSSIEPEKATHPSTEAEDATVDGSNTEPNDSDNVGREVDSKSIDEGEVDEEAAPPLPDEAPPLPNEEAPPLPKELPPAQEPVDDGWDPVWDENAQAFYFYNRFTGLSQWDNPRVPEATAVAAAPGTEAPAPKPERPVGGYDPAIHGDYDPNADYAQVHAGPNDGDDAPSAAIDPAQAYAATGTFNRFTGKWQAATLTPDNYNDEAKSGRQMNAFFDVDAAANSHDGRSLKAERSNKKLSRAEVKAFKEKRREKKEEKRRAWLRD